jgi:hypothetical protein
MKQFFLVVFAFWLISCNNSSESRPGTDADRTTNNDTGQVAAPDTGHLNTPISSGSDTSALRR